jgi:hypothetical protein
MAAEFYGKEYVLFEGGTLNNTEGALRGLHWLATGPAPSETRRWPAEGAAARAVLPALQGLAPPPGCLARLCRGSGPGLTASCCSAAAPAGAPARLADLFARVDGAKRRSVVQHMSKDLVPISEKGLVDCPLVHR